MNLYGYHGNKILKSSRSRWMSLFKQYFLFVDLIWVVRVEWRLRVGNLTVFAFALEYTIEGCSQSSLCIQWMIWIHSCENRADTNKETYKKWVRVFFDGSKLAYTFLVRQKHMHACIRKNIHFDIVITATAVKIPWLQSVSHKNPITIILELLKW